MGKTKSSKRSSKDTTEMQVDTTPTKVSPSLEFVSPIAQPLADEKLRKSLTKTIKKAAGKKHVLRGTKEVTKAMRKGSKGLMVLAGDISPIDILAHFPVFCEDKGIPYVFLPTKKEIGAACNTKRPTCCCLIVPGGKAKDEKALDEYKSNYDACVEAVKAINNYI
ncbi:snoRNA-binding protein [Dispira simplex]|nr:snoRNA-binding protein [Dispira simplex]